MFMCFAVALMPVMNTIAKSLAAEYPLQQIVWARFTGHFLIMALLFMPKRGWRVFATSRPLTQFARSLTMFTSNGCYIVALSLIPLATASSVSFTAPLIGSCADHENGGSIFVHQWNGKDFEKVTDLIPPMTDIVRPMLEDAAAKYISDKPEWQTQTCG